jgi:putative phosphoesterase
MQDFPAKIAYKMPMKIAVLSDIHGNLPALRTAANDVARWQPDLVVVNGDIVNRGPHSLSCLNFVQHKERVDGWHLLRGNHEDFLVGCAHPNRPRSGPKYELIRFALWSCAQLNDNVATLAKLPDRFSWTAPDGSEIRITHGSMVNNRDGIFPKTSDEEIRCKIQPAPAVFVTAHTHVPLIRQVDDTLVVNVGSVGAPFDGDRRPSYGRFQWQPATGWQAGIVRLNYDQQEIERDYVESGFLAEAGPFAQLMLVELRLARGLIFRWIQRYQEKVLAGKIDMESSVRHLLQDEAIRPYTGPPGWSLSLPSPSQQHDKSL